MLNTRSIMNRSLEAIFKCSRLKRKINHLQLRNDMLLHLEHILSNILINLADHYSYPK